MNFHLTVGDYAITVCAESIFQRCAVVQTQTGTCDIEFDLGRLVIVIDHDDDGGVPRSSRIPILVFRNMKVDHTPGSQRLQLAPQSRKTFDVLKQLLLIFSPARGGESISFVAW